MGKLYLFTFIINRNSYKLGCLQGKLTITQLLRSCIDLCEIWRDKTHHISLYWCRYVHGLGLGSYKNYKPTVPCGLLLNLTVYERLDAMIGPILWGHSGPLCHALSLSSSLSMSWTTMRRRRATVPLATSAEWA